MMETVWWIALIVWLLAVVYWFFSIRRDDLTGMWAAVGVMVVANIVQWVAILA